MRLTQVPSALVVSLLGLTVSLPAMHGQAVPGLEQAMKAGATAMQQGHPDVAEASFRRAVQLAPNVANLHLDLGLALLREGKLQEAEAELKQAGALDPHLTGTAMFLGIAQYELGQLDDARASLKQAIEANPDNADAEMWLGVVELAADRPEAAVGPLDKAAALAPDNLEILDYRGRAHSLVSRASYARMAKLDPDSWHVHRALGQSFSEQGQPKQAIAEYQLAIARNPRNADLYEALGDEYRKVSQFDLAQNAYQKELELSPNNPIALFNLGSIHIDRDDAQTGVPMVEKAKESLGNKAPVYFYLGLGMAKLDRNQEAIANLTKAIAIDPSGHLVERAYYEESRVYRKLGKTVESQAALREFTKLRAASGSRDNNQTPPESAGKQPQ